MRMYWIIFWISKGVVLAPRYVEVCYTERVGVTIDRVIIRIHMAVDRFRHCSDQSLSTAIFVDGKGQGSAVPGARTIR